MSQLSVLHDDQLVGSLASESRDLHFQYSPEWLGGKHSFPLCPQLPLRPELFIGMEVLHFFSNLLPEGRILSAILKLKRLPEGDVLSQLQAFGEEAAGAFAIVPSGNARRRKPHYIPYTPKMIREDFAKVEAHIPLLTRHGELRLSLAGAQNKITVKHDAATGTLWLPADGAVSTHILKPPIAPATEFPDSVWNEAICMRLAEACGLGAASSEVHEAGAAPALLIARFDREHRDARLLRLHQLDFCQLAGILPDQKYESQGGPSLERMFALVKTHVSVPGPDIVRLADWVVFNYLIGNSDAHAKNAAVLVESGGRMRLAPFYDLLSTAIYPDLEKRMAMSIGGEFRPDWVRAKNWKAFAEGAGLQLPLFRRRSASIASRTAQRLPEIAKGLGLASNRKIIARLQETIRSRARKLEIHLQAA